MSCTYGFFIYTVFQCFSSKIIKLSPSMYHGTQNCLEMRICLYFPKWLTVLGVLQNWKSLRFWVCRKLCLCECVHRHNKQLSCSCSKLISCFIFVLLGMLCCFVVWCMKMVNSYSLCPWYKMGLPNNMDVSTVLKKPFVEFCGFIQDKLFLIWN